jgi:hypothetical protein
MPVTLEGIKVNILSAGGLQDSNPKKNKNKIFLSNKVLFMIAFFLILRYIQLKKTKACKITGFYSINTRNEI